MNRTKNLKIDGIIWIVLMLLAAAVAFGLLRRDAQRDFGAVSFGAFPEFNLSTIDGKKIDHHLLKGNVWAVHCSRISQEAFSIAQELNEIKERTASGKRHLFILSVLEDPATIDRSMSEHHYIVQAGVQERSLLLTAFGPSRESIVLLVDQNSIIRGRYDIKDVDGLRAFQGDLKRIL